MFPTFLHLRDGARWGIYENQNYTFKYKDCFVSSVNLFGIYSLVFKSSMGH